MSDAPARRYAYYLTPQGFAEKSRLTVQYLSSPFSFFRLAKSGLRARASIRPRQTAFPETWCWPASRIWPRLRSCARSMPASRSSRWSIPIAMSRDLSASRSASPTTRSEENHSTPSSSPTSRRHRRSMRPPRCAAQTACSRRRLLGLHERERRGADAMSEAVGARWYVVQTQVNGEAKAAHNLLRQGFEIYLPRYLKRRRHARKVGNSPQSRCFRVTCLLLIDMATQRWRSIQSTQGVSRLVCNGEEPAAVHGRRARCAEGARGRKWFRQNGPGPICARRQGAGACRRFGKSGLFDGMGDHDRVAILLDMLGRKVRVSSTRNWSPRPEAAAWCARIDRAQNWIRRSGERESPGLR